MQHLHSKEVFHLFLQKTILTENNLEKTLTIIRREILLKKNNDNFFKNEKHKNFLISLAEQCWLNEYIWFETKVKVGDSEGSAIELCVGLTVNFATNPENMLAATDRIVFQVDDGDTNIDCVTEKDGTATTTDSGVDIADDTYVTLGFHVTDAAKVEFFVNRNLVATHTANIPDDENLAIGAMELSGSATGTKSATIDYLFASQTR